MDKKYYMEQFKKEKGYVKQILSKGVFFPNDGNLDINIRELVFALNNLDVAYTTYSCSGHFNTREDIIKRHPDSTLLILPKKGTGYYFRGYLGLNFAPSGVSRELITAIQKIPEKYAQSSIKPYVEIGPPIIHTDEKSLQNLSIIMHFDKRYPNKYGRPPCLPVNEGLKKMEDHKTLIKDLEQTIKKISITE